MCQIVSEYMQTSNFSYFCILVTAIRVFTTPTHGQPSVPWNCGHFARSSCFLWLRERFWRINSNCWIQFSWLIAEIWNVCGNRTSGQMTMQLCRTEPLQASSQAAWDGDGQFCHYCFPHALHSEERGRIDGTSYHHSIISPPPILVAKPTWQKGGA